MLSSTLFSYLASRTLIAIGGLLIILISLILLVDLIENLSFVGKTEGAGFGLAVTLTLLRAPSLAQMLFPFVFLFGSIWMFHQLNKRSELAVMRSAGMSIWRLLWPASLIAAFGGALIVIAIDPLASRMLSYAEALQAQSRGAEKSLVKVLDDGIWLRQDSENAHVLINAKTLIPERGALEDVTVWRFTTENAFVERIDAVEAILSGAVMNLHQANVTALDDDLSRTAPIYAIPTQLTPEDLGERALPPETVSLWRLPHYIDLAEAAGLPTVRYQIRFHDLCSTPLKLLAMVLIAAAFSIRPTRLGGQFQLVLMSIGAGFALYMLSSISTALGESKTVPVLLAAWAPAVIAALSAVSALLYLEDG